MKAVKWGGSHIVRIGRSVDGKYTDGIIHIQKVLNVPRLSGFWKKVIHTFSMKG